MSIFSIIFGKKNAKASDSATKQEAEPVVSDIELNDARRDHIAFVDTEVGLKDHKIHDIGALRYDGATFHQASKTELEKFLEEGKVDFICGHNIIHHDAHYLQLNGILIDTLYLSPLLFPKHPYHHLVKDDKLMSEQMNNPVNDCEKAKELLMDEIATWNKLSENKKRIFTLLLQQEEEFKGFLIYVGATGTSSDAIKEVSDTILSEYKNHMRPCRHSLSHRSVALRLGIRLGSDWNRRLPIRYPRMGAPQLSRGRAYHQHALPSPMHRRLRVLPSHAQHPP